MKRLLCLAPLLMMLSASSVFISLPGPGHFYGAWKMQMKADGKTRTTVKIYTKDYFVFSTYNTADKEYFESGGGTWIMDAKGITETYEFNTQKPELVSTSISYAFEGDHEDEPMILGFSINGIKVKQAWSRIDDGKSPLFGAWRITQREREGEMTTMQLGPRKTMKVISGTRFQWAAFNVETKSFMGTGGGTFTSKGGKYVESIEFFSRDSSRVGLSLEFDYKVEGKEWYHSGLSSRGDPISEVWTNQDK